MNDDHEMSISVGFSGGFYHYQIFKNDYTSSFGVTSNSLDNLFDKLRDDIKIEFLRRNNDEKTKVG